MPKKTKGTMTVRRQRRRRRQKRTRKGRVDERRLFHGLFTSASGELVCSLINRIHPASVCSTFTDTKPTRSICDDATCIFVTSGLWSCRSCPLSQISATSPLSCCQIKVQSQECVYNNNNNKKRNNNTNRCEPDGSCAEIFSLRYH